MKEKIYIFGGGFSSAIAKIYLNNKSKLFTLNNWKILDKIDLFRRKNIESNKLFAVKSTSFGSLDFLLKNSKFHDRLLKSGNSSIWG